jgi:GT2 family glycosyltransferase
MKLSIIVPVGRPETARQTLESILRQGPCPGLEQIILVGAGMDALREQFRDPRIQCVELQGRLNPSATRIAGVAHATGDWYLFVDDDIELDGLFLERLTSVIAGENHAGAIGARLPGRERSYFSRVTDLANFWSQQSLRSGPRDWLYSAVLAVPRRVYDEVGGFNPELAIGEDVDLTRRISQAGYRVLYRADLVGVHNHRRTTLSRALAYSWHNGGLALFQFKGDPQVRAWSVKMVLRTLALSLLGTCRLNGRDGYGFYWYLPGIISFYFVFALSLECHYQRCLFEFLRDKSEPDSGSQPASRNIFVGKYAASRVRGRMGRALLFLIMAVLRENILLILMMGALFAVLVAGPCASV